MKQINFKTTGVACATAQMERLASGAYVVHNGVKQGRRTAIFSTYNREEAEAELAQRIHMALGEREWLRLNQED